LNKPGAIERVQMSATQDQKNGMSSMGMRRRGPWVMVALVVALVALVGCNRSGDGGSSSESGGGDAIKIGVLMPDLTISTLSATLEGAQKRAKHYENVTVVASGSTDTTTFVNQCQQLVSSGVQAIAYDTFDSPGTAACVASANQAGVKVICLYSCSPGTNDATIEAEWSEGGRLIGEWMAKQLNAAGKYKVAMLEGAAGDTVAPLMQDQFKKTLAADCPDCEIVAVSRSAEDRNSGYQEGLKLLAANPDLDAIYAFQDDQGLGVQQAVQQQGRAGEVLVASFNGSCNAVASVLDQKMGLTILFPGQPYGAQAVDAAVALVEGKDVPPKQTILVPIDHDLAQGVLDGTATLTDTQKQVDLEGLVTSASNDCE
jgi:galactofuranose transport system substrate-binding protein